MRLPRFGGRVSQTGWQAVATAGGRTEDGRCFNAVLPQGPRTPVRSNGTTCWSIIRRKIIIARRTFIATAAAVLAVSAVGACAPRANSVDSTVSYRERLNLPADSQVEVPLADVPKGQRIGKATGR